MTPEKRASLIDIIDDYMVFSVLEGSIGPLGGISGTSRDDLVKKASVDIMAAS
jgi:hypothetical protein